MAKFIRRSTEKPVSSLSLFQISHAFSFAATISRRRFLSSTLVEMGHARDGSCGLAVSSLNWIDAFVAATLHRLGAVSGVGNETLAT